MIEIKIEVDGKPPTKQTPADPKEKEDQKQRKNIFLRKIKENHHDIVLLEGNVRLDIKVHRNSFKNDSANIVGGIADILQNIAYINDKQIKQIHYTEENSDKDRYIVKVFEI